MFRFAASIGRRVCGSLLVIESAGASHGLIAPFQELKAQGMDVLAPEFYLVSDVNCSMPNLFAFCRPRCEAAHSGFNAGR